MLRLKWVPSIDAGWSDLNKRRAFADAGGRGSDQETTVSLSRAPQAVAAPPQVEGEGSRGGVANVIHFNGRPIKDAHHGWEVVRIAAGATTVDRPHVLRHSCVTLFVKAGLAVYRYDNRRSGEILPGSLEDQQNIAATTSKITPRNGAKPAATK